MANWPWRRRATHERTVLCTGADHFTYLAAGADGRLSRCGVERRGTDDAAGFARRLRGLRLPPQGAVAMLPLARSQLVQIDAPAVRPEEMRAAARWHAKDLVDGRIDELTIDVMFVGDDRERPHRQLFVAAAPNATIREVDAIARSAGLELAAIDIGENAQRNLQSRLASAAGLGERATAALVRHDDTCLLTICAGGELYYARRLPWEGLARVGPEPVAPAPDVAALQTLDFVDYGAEPEDTGPAGSEPRLVVELQRSFDVWERSWPDLPLARLWVWIGDESEALRALLETSIGLPVGVVDPARAFPELTTLTDDAEVKQALTPLLGAVLRTDERRL